MAMGEMIERQALDHALVIAKGLRFPAFCVGCP
jgi:hypothetical protein